MDGAVTENAQAHCTGVPFLTALTGTLYSQFLKSRTTRIQ